MKYALFGIGFTGYTALVCVAQNCITEAVRQADHSLLLWGAAACFALGAFSLIAVAVLSNFNQIDKIAKRRGIG
jgi:hypothetical protein